MEPTREHKEEDNIICFPGADFPPESKFYIIRKINDKDLSISEVMVTAACTAILGLFAFYGFIIFLSNM